MRNFYIIIFLLFCFLGKAQSVELYNPSPGNGTPYPSQQYFCAGEQFNLKVDATATSTGDYAITKENPNNFPLTSGGIAISFPATGSNKFSNSFPIGFTFSFYGKEYNKVVAGSNGRLVFTNNPILDNLNTTSTYIDRTFSGITGHNTFSSLPSTDYNKIFQTPPTQELNLAQIFFGYTDLIPKSQNSSVNYFYKNVTVGSHNALLVTYQNQIRSNGTGGFSSSTYNSNILLIDDGRLIIYVSNKTEDTYNAILGLQNDNASKFKVPSHGTFGSNYNNGKWKSEGVAFLFTPNQNLTPEFKWFNNGTALNETSDTLSNFSPNDGDVLKVEVTYHDTAGTQVGAAVSDQVSFKNIIKPTISYNSSAACVSGVTMSVPADPNLNFQWFRTGSTSVLGTGNSYYASQNGNYFVRVSRISAPVCFVDSDPVPVNLNSTIPPFNPDNVSLNYCDTAGATSRIINLYDYYPPNSSQYTLQFIDGVTQVPDPANFIIFANSTRTIGIYANDPISDCTVLRNFDIRYDSLPMEINNLAKSYCFGETSINISQFLQDIAGTNFNSFDYEYSTDGTTYSTNSVINPKLFPKIWLKISPKNPPAGSCTTVSTIILTEDNEMEIKPYSQFPAHCTSPTEFFDLNITKSELEYSPDIKASFYTDSTQSNEITNLNYQGSGTIYIKVENTITGCMALSVPTLTLVIYSPPTLIKNGPEQKLSQCGTTQFDLTTNINDYINWTRYSEIRYFDGNGNPLATPAQYKNYDASVSGFNPYMIFVYNETNNLNCSNRIDFNLIEIKKPVAITNQIQICAETIYSLQDFKNKVASNPSLYIFTDLSGTVLTNDFTWSTLPFTVNFLMKDIANNCVSNPQTVTFVQGGSSSILTTQTDYFLCDSDFDGKTEFNLDSQKSNFTTDNTAFFEYFKNSILSQKIDDPTTFTNDDPFEQTVYAKITILGFCPSVAQIHLKVNTPTKSSTLQDQYFICYGESLTIYGGSDGVDGSKNIAWEYNVEGVISTDENLYLQNPKPGTYTVKLTNVNGCSYTHSFIISDENQPKIDVINQTNTSIEVIANGGKKPYKYYFNGVPQASNILQNPTQSSYEIQVESADGCFGPPKTVYFIKINNAITPNADGKNDTWKIDDLDKMQNVSILIMDRNGLKVFESTNPSKSEWDGKSNGRELPTASYWYLVSWFDPVTQKTEQRQGWILLKNRN